MTVALAQMQRDADVPEFPFPDNPDPSQCGIPEIWREDEAAGSKPLKDKKAGFPNPF
jgi:hypothetical protein